MAKLKLFKKPSETGNYTIDFSDLLSEDETLSSIIIIYVTPDSLTISNQQINSAIVNDIKIGKAVLCTLSGGLNGYEYTVTVKVTTSESETLETDVVLSVIETLPLKLDYYGSVLEGDTYFNNVLSNDAWIGATNPHKRVALIQASLQIDTYNFKGSKLISDQILQFPRDFQTDIPEQILYATFELAYQLLKGKNREKIASMSGLKRDRFDKIETEYDPRYISEATRNHMPSTAWSYIKPYLRDTAELTIERVS